MAAPQPRFVRCPSCQWGTLADGNFCAYCGRPLRPQGAAAPPTQYPPQQAAPQAQPQYSQSRPAPNYYQPQGAQQGGQYAGGGAGGRPPLQCPNCGMLNDPWLTHCKQCQRPLMTSG